MTSALLLALVGTQSLSGRTPEEASRLRPGEIVRIFKSGGLTPEGLYQSLVAVRWDGTVYFKRMRFATTIRLGGEQLEELKAAIRSYDPSAMDAGSKPPHPPSAVDASDIYLSVRKGESIHRWSNVDHEAPAVVDVIDVLAKIEMSAR
jgi:hypothetical protein